MKQILFVSTNRILFQGVQSALNARPELERSVILSGYREALDDLNVFGTDAVFIDATDGAVTKAALELCREIHALDQGQHRCMILVQQQNLAAKQLVLQAREDGTADDFVFYDSSMDYLLAKLAAL